MAHQMIRARSILHTTNDELYPLTYRAQHSSTCIRYSSDSEPVGHVPMEGHRDPRVGTRHTPGTIIYVKLQQEINYAYIWHINISSFNQLLSVKNNNTCAHKLQP